MLEAALEQLLLRFLAPYVDGISRDKLHLGVFSGCLELKDLQVKPDALVLLGLEGFRVRSGSIRMIRLNVPLSRIVNGKLRAVVQMVRLEVEQIGDSSTPERSEADLIEEVRDAKRKAVELRVAQLRELLEQQREQAEAAEAGGQGSGYAMKLLRKIVNNIHVDLSDLQVAFVSRSRGLACGFELPMLAVLSTDQTFRERAETEEVNITGSSMYKLMRLRGLGARLSAAGACSLDGADYALSPISARLQLAHVPSDQILRVRVEVATTEVAELTLLRSQAKHLLSVQAASLAEAARLRALLVPPDEERTIYLDPLAAAREYATIYEQKLSFEWKVAGEARRPLSPGEAGRLQLLEDALSVRLLAKQRWLVHNKFEALNEEVARRIREAERARAEAQKRNGGLLRRVAGYVAGAEADAPAAPAPPAGAAWLTAAEQRELLQELGGETKVEAVDLPSRLNFEFVLGKVAVDLVDDRWPDEAGRQLLSLALQDANWKVHVDMATDHRGQDSSEWRVECCLSAFRALHAGRITFRLRPPKGPGEEVEDDLGHDGTCAARLVLENKLEPEQNLLRLQFEFAPLEVHMLPGVLEQLLEFFRAPEMPEGPAGVGLEDVMGMSKELVATHGDAAKEVAERVYGQIPDRVHLDVRIASPSIHVPVEGLGAATFSLGHLRLFTPDPCAYDKIVLAITLNNTALQAVSARGERFNMIQPVPVNISIKYRAVDDENALEIHVKFEEVGLSLAPQALQILLATPGAMASIMSVTEPTPQLAVSRETGVQEDVPEAELPTFTELLQEVLGEDAGGMEAAARRLGEVREKQFRLNLTVQLDALDVTLSDSIVPVMRLHSQMLQPGLVLYWQSTPSILLMNIDDGLLEVDVLRPEAGVWEPLVERLHVGLQVVQKPEEDADSSATHVVVSGHEPLLLNLTPSAVRQASWILPLFVASLSSSPPDLQAEAAVEAAPSHAGGAKYRVVNLCDYPLELEFRSRHRTGLVMQVKPTGSSWESLDDWVLPHFATAVAVRAPGGGASEPLLLERPGAAPVPESSAVAELLAPGRAERLLLLATPLRVHNQTDFPLLVRFHDPVQREVLMVDVPLTASCDAALLGLNPPEHSAAEAVGTPAPAPATEVQAVVLAPNALCAVPAPAMVRSRGASGAPPASATGAAVAPAASPRAWLSVRPAGLPLGFSAPLEAGAGLGPRSVACNRRADANTSGGAGAAPEGGLDSINFVCESHTCLAGTSSAVALTTVALRPPLALLNALPIGDLAVGYAPGFGGQARGQAWREARVPRLVRLNLYSFPSLPSEGGVSVCVRLEDGAPWSPVAHFEASAFSQNPSGPTGQTLPLRQLPGGAAAGLLAEASGHYEMRLSCPNWFIDRSGLSRPLVLEMLRDGQQLPHADGITLLPSDCHEEHCTLLLRSTFSNFAMQTLRMPPSWGVLAWRTRYGPFVFCLQTEDVAAGSALGARCQVTTLRPRLVLTNASPCDIELQLGENKLLRLASGQSLESHWPVVQGDEDLPATCLRFRPLREAPCQWSGAVLCADSAAGSTPLLLPGCGEGGEGGTGAEVWSAEVAPERGALAVSLRCGSDFVAVNRAMRTQAHMAVRPLGGRGAPPELAVPPGREVEYGWTQPFLGERQWSVEVLVSGMRCRVKDVRRTIRHVLRPLGLVISAARRGTQTLLLLEDYEPSATRASGSTGSSPEGSGSCSGPAWLQRVEVKLSSMGVSLVDEAPQAPRELLYLHLDLVRMEWRQNVDDVQQLKLAISELQVDCQLPGRADGRAGDPHRGLLHKERPAVIVANCGDGDRAFLSLLVQRSATSSRDLLLPYVEVALDSMDVTIDDGWLDPLASFLARAWPETLHGLHVNQIATTAGQPIIEGYVTPVLPPVVQVDAVKISSICLTVWCILKLKSVHFLPAYLRAAIRVLSLSGKLTLDGAPLVLPERRLPSHRGSLTDFVRGLANEYMVNLLNNAGSVLGKSSVLNLPRAPLKLGGTAVSYLTDGIGLAAGEAASLLSQLTFDEEYVAQQRRIRSGKRILGLGDGVVEAGKSLVQGVEGLLDVVKKPAEGARHHGLGGFLAGVGRGMVGSFVKPVSKLGQAISDVGSGIAAQVTPDSASMKRRRARLRQRQPRLLFSAYGTLRPWSELEAELLRHLGAQLAQGVEEVIPLASEGSERAILAVFPERLVVLQVPPQADAASQPRARGGGGGAPERVGQAGERPRAGRCPEPCLVGRASGIRLADLRAARASDGGDALELEDLQGRLATLPLATVGERVREALLAGLRAALADERRIACWEELRQAVDAERRGRRHLRGRGASSGERTLEVLEVERRNPAAGWQTPFLPTDGELSWRWVDATGCKHPHLIQQLSRREAAALRMPPCRLDALFRSSSEWALDVGPETDANGWRYGLAWNSSTWDSRPGMVNSLRKRRWTRSYV